MFGATIFTCLLAYALAQDSSTTSDASNTDSIVESASVVSLFLPMGSPDQIEGSVISASPNQTAFALGCTNNATTEGCGWYPPITVTEGESTIIYTNTHQGQEDVSYNIPHQTLMCELVGAHTSEVPLHGATSAVCIGSSAVSGLGVVVSTSVLASTEINYVPVTLTAGVQKIIEASRSAATAMPGTSSSAAGAAAPVMTAMAKYGLGGAVGMAIWGVL